MAKIDQLPPELVMAIMDSIARLPDTAVYSDKERQRDLASFALVNKQFSAAATRLLYAGKATLRNAGRSHLFARTLEQRLDLAQSLQTLDCTSTQDSCFPNHLNRVLKLPDVRLTSLAIGESYFTHGPASIQALELLLDKPMRSFTWIGSFRWFYEVKLWRLLTAWHKLKHLALELASAVDRALDARIDKTRPKPLYKLTSFRIQCHEWCLRAGYVEWYLGHSAGTIERLSLSILSSWQIGVRPFDERDLPRLAPYLESCTHLSLKLDWCSFDVLDQLLASTPRLLSFRFEYTSSSEESDIGKLQSLPSQLHSIELVGRRLFQRVGLLDALENGWAPPSLSRVTILGHFDSDAPAREAKWICQAARVHCVVKPIFATR
ncbi:hypothetical protein OIO90_003730 [Microbotryomycetes sp. JL221]|nr:hypothetical protein OIO90_003730 [Microbotryomycetes sp. JL221]